MHTTSITTLALALLTSATSAQGNVWTVGGVGADFLQIQPAVDAASDGDLILVRESGGNPYSSFSVNGKSLTIQGEGEGEAVAVQSGLFSIGPLTPVTILNVGPLQSVTVRNLGFNSFTLDDFADAARVWDCDGPVVFEDCEFYSWTRSGLDVIRSLGVTFERCTIESRGTYWYSYLGQVFESPGLLSRDSVLFLHDCEVIGGPGFGASSTFTGQIPASVGSPGMVVRSGQAFLQGTTVRGGDGGAGVAQLCAPGEAGGHAVEVGAWTTGPGLVRVFDSTLLPGGGGVPDPECALPAGPDGLDVFLEDGARVDLDGVARSFVWSSPVREGESLDATYTGVPGDLVFLIYAPGPVQGFFFDSLQVAVHFDLVQFQTLFRGVLPASGELADSFLVPPLSPAKEFARVLGQVMIVDASLVDVWTSGPSTTAILDETF